MVRLNNGKVLIKPLRKRGELTDLVGSKIEKVSDFVDTRKLRTVHTVRFYPSRGLVQFQ